MAVGLVAQHLLNTTARTQSLPGSHLASAVTLLPISAARTVTKWNIFSMNTSVTANCLSDFKSLNLQALAQCRCWNKGLEIAQGQSRSSSQCVSFGQALLTSLQKVWHLGKRCQTQASAATRAPGTCMSSQPYNPTLVESSFRWRLSGGIVVIRCIK